MKISIKELRIGNLALFDGRIVVVWGFGRTIFDYGLISDHVDIYNIDDHEDDYVSIKSLKPIPLTEEWLLKFGFKKRESSVSDSFYIGENPTTRDWMFDIFWIKNMMDYSYEDYPFYRNGHFKIKSVHQLQNLYFALTGEDLEFKTKND
jgi:hypothetical protein